MTTPLERVLDALGERVTRRREDRAEARCPAHDDRRASLAIGVGSDGRALIHCHAGCESAAVLQALGLDERDLFPSDLPDRETPPPSGRSLIATYDYVDADGNLLYQVCRFSPKDFRQRRPDGARGWTWNLRGVRRVPYRLPALLRAVAAGETILIVEGEKDCGALAQIGLTATTNPSGAGKWSPEFAGYLAAACVVIIPDNDAPGREHAEQVAQALHDTASEIRVLHLPNLPSKGDVSDWLAAGGSPAALRELIAAAPAWHPRAHDEPPDGRVLKAVEDTDRPALDWRINVVTLSNVEPEDVSWLWNHYVPSGKLTVLEGDPGLGKSTLTIAIAAAVSTGEALPGGQSAMPADVLFLTYEDGLADTVRPRLQAAGGDPQRVHVLQGVAYGREAERPVSLDDVAALRLAIEEYGIRLVVIDPLAAAIGSRTDSYKDADIRRALAPLARCAEETGAAILVVRHLSKARTGYAITAGGGSIGIAGAARSVLALHRDPDDPERRMLAVVKSNLGPPAPSQRFRLEDTGAGAARVVWEGTSSRTANELTAARAEDPRQRSAGDEAAAWLSEALADGPRPKRDLVEAAQSDGIGIRALERAKERLGVLHRRDGFGSGGVYVWFLPDSCSPKSPMLTESHPAPLGGEHILFGEAESPVAQSVVTQTDVDDDPRPFGCTKCSRRFYGDVGAVCFLCLRSSAASDDGRSTREEAEQ